MSIIGKIHFANYVDGNLAWVACTGGYIIKSDGFKCNAVATDDKRLVTCPDCLAGLPPEPSRSTQDEKEGGRD